MKRRELIAVLSAAAAAWPFTTRAERGSERDGSGFYVLRHRQSTNLTLFSAHLQNVDTCRDVTMSSYRNGAMET